MLSAVFKVDYLAKDTADAMTFDIVFEMAMREKYSVKEFNETFLDFLKRAVYVNWTPAEFFKKDRPKLYPESWKTAEYQKNPNALKDIEGFEVPLENGKTVVMYRYFDGTEIKNLKKVFPKECEYVVKSCFDADYKDYYNSQFEVPNELTTIVEQGTLRKYPVLPPSEPATQF